MARFLAAIDGLSDEEAAVATGINRESIRLYRSGEWSRFTGVTERRMRAYIERKRSGLGELPADASGYARGLLHAADEMEKKVRELRALAAATSGAVDPDGDVDDAFGPGGGGRRRPGDS